VSDFRSDRREIDGNVRTAFIRSNEDCVADADENAPTHEGTLRGSLTWRWVAESTSSLKSQFGSALRYAAIRELGGVIRPVRAKRLVWRDYEGRFHSAKEVIQKPGGRVGSRTHNKPYLKPAGEKFPDHMEAHLKRLG
jgi:hypothetical protein